MNYSILIDFCAYLFKKKIFIKGYEEEHSTNFLWSLQEFNWQYQLMMREYEKFKESGKNKEKMAANPFKNDPTTPYLIGLASYPLKTIYHLKKISDKQRTKIFNYDGLKLGEAVIKLQIAFANGVALNDQEISEYSENTFEQFIEKVSREKLSLTLKIKDIFIDNQKFTHVKKKKFF